jgi:glyoxylase-like metal-dependent hydrolase (beta-lactamase superfamily II)
LHLGPYELTTIDDGRFALDGGAMFGTVPRVLWERSNPPDEQNRIGMALRTLLIRGEGRTILVDTGLGDKFPEKHLAMYRVERRGGVVAGLASLGVAPEEVTDVLLTHLHFDHGGGGTRRDGAGSLVPTFSAARYHLQEENLRVASLPNERERASYLPENLQPLRDAGCLEVHSGGYELAPGVEILVSHGHTRGMQMVLVSSPGAPPVFYPADLIPSSSHLRIPWVMGYDLWPLTVMEEKRALLERAVREGWVLIFEHDPSMAACTVNFDGKNYGAGIRVDTGELRP